MKKKLVLINYGVGNILSIKNAFNHLEHEIKLSSDKSEIEDASHLILPGVGSFPAAMQKLGTMNLLETIRKVSENKKTFILGICLGMQLFFERSFEFKETIGLKILKGDVKLLNDQKNRKDIKLPNIGWKKLIIDKKNKNPIVKNITVKDYFYFVHTFAAFNTNGLSNITNSNYYNINFPAIIQKDNIFGCQFHPEKSANSGLKILQNFINLK
jgi:imidazole glycerol-phosphate synthase subunit HisH